MSIEIRKNKKPELPVCEMSCDKPLHPKLDKYDMTRACFQRAHTCGVLGKPGQGKSSLLYSFFKSPSMLKKCFTTIYYVCPVSSMLSMADNIFARLPEDQIYNELNGEVIDEIITRCENREEGDKIALIIDDFASSLKSPEVQRGLKKLAANKRHLGVYGTFILSQTWKSVPLETRRLYDNIIVFKIGADEMSTLFSEIMPHLKDYSQVIQKAVYDKPHQYLMINTATGRLFKGFDEIIINED